MNKKATQIPKVFMAFTQTKKVDMGSFIKARIRIRIRLKRSGSDRIRINLSAAAIDNFTVNFLGLLRPMGMNNS
jgi:hypothetical protein